MEELLSWSGLKPPFQIDHDRGSSFLLFDAPVSISTSLEESLSNRAFFFHIMTLVGNLA